MLLTLKIRKGNVQLFAWQLFHVRLEHSGVGKYDRGPLEIYWQAGREVRWFIYDNGAWWHHTIKSSLRGQMACAGTWVWVFVFAMHEYIRCRVGQWLTLLSCDVLWHLCYVFFSFFHAETVGPRELLWLRRIHVGDPDPRRINTNGPFSQGVDWRIVLETIWRLLAINTGTKLDGIIVFPEGTL